MLEKTIANSLKAFKFSVMGRKSVAGAFPTLIANCCKSMKIINIYGQYQAIHYDWNKLLIFEMNLGTAIYNNNFDTLDNIIIEFFHCYHYQTVTPDGQFVMFEVDFPDEAIKKFETICNKFKGKEWDDILDKFIDAFFEFVNLATVHKEEFTSWH